MVLETKSRGVEQGADTGHGEWTVVNIFREDEQHPMSSFELSNAASKPGPSGAAHIMPTSTFSSGGKYPWRTDVKAFPSREHRVSIESFFRTALHQMGAVSERSGMVDQSEKSRVNTTLA